MSPGRADPDWIKDSTSAQIYFFFVKSSSPNLFASHMYPFGHISDGVEACWSSIWRHDQLSFVSPYEQLCFSNNQVEIEWIIKNKAFEAHLYDQ